MGSERRLNKRVQEQIAMTFMVIDKMNPGILDAQDLLKIRDGILLDFSSTGVSMQTKDLLPRWIPYLETSKLFIGIQFQFSFEARPVYAVCNVMWVKKVSPGKQYYLLGLRFTNISNLDLFKIRKYVIGDNIAKV